MSRTCSIGASPAATNAVRLMTDPWRDHPWFVDLTADEARALGRQLIACADYLPFISSVAISIADQPGRHEVQELETE